jgi:hypothetical protein
MKHAYLIIAHNEFDILEKLLMLLDDVRNDIYIHIDKKNKNFPFDEFLKITRYSPVYFVERLNVCWGDFSMVKCELLLLKAAVRKEYQYYHLISGVDLPIKSNKEIHDFFDAHNGMEFVHYNPENMAEKLRARIEKYYIMSWYRTTQRGLVGFCKKNADFSLKKTVVHK